MKKYYTLDLYVITNVIHPYKFSVIKYLSQISVKQRDEMRKVTYLTKFSYYVHQVCSLNTWLLTILHNLGVNMC